MQKLVKYILLLWLVCSLAIASTLMWRQASERRKGIIEFQERNRSLPPPQEPSPTVAPRY